MQTKFIVIVILNKEDCIAKTDECIKNNKFEELKSDPTKKV